MLKSGLQTIDTINEMSPQPSTNKYQIAGLDDLERGFNRQVEIKILDEHYQAIFRYEKLLMTTDLHETESAALLNLIHQLHQKGYTQLRSRIHFRGELYLGNQEIWDEHPDPERTGKLSRFLHVILNKFRGKDQSM